MADENQETTEETTSVEGAGTETTGAETADTETVADDKHPAQTESEFMEETIADIKETQKAIQEQETGETGETDGGGAVEAGTVEVREDLAGTDIPDEFTNAAEAIGMTADEIIALADQYDDAQLLEMIPTLESEAGSKAETETKTEDESKAGVDDDVQQKIIEQVTKQLTEQFGVSLDELKEFKTQQTAQRQKEALATVDRKFDEAVKDFSVFGKTEELPRFKTGKLAGQLIPTSPAVKARKEVVQYAEAFVKTGRSIEEAMDDALALYAGKHLRKEMERKLIKDLKQHEQNLSGGRVGKETKKTGLDPRSDMIDEIRQLQRQAGIDV